MIVLLSFNRFTPHNLLAIEWLIIPYIYIMHCWSERLQQKLMLTLGVSSHEITYKQFQYNVQPCILFFQLILEKQKLIAMQLHLHLSERKYTDLVCWFLQFLN